MNRLFIALAFFLTLTSSAMAQNYTRHTVTKGETVTQIAARYKVTPYDIYKLNPDAQGGIKEQDVILIPASVVTGGTEQKPQPKSAPASGGTHTAEPKETLYSIARKYGVSVDEIRAANGDALKDGLKIGQTIKIPGGSVASRPAVAEKKEPVKETPKAETKPEAAPKPAAKAASGAVTHVVQPKETKFGIAKKYGISVAELEKQNPGVVANLPVGYELHISGSKAASAQTQEDRPVAEKPKPVVTEIAQKEQVQSETVKSTRFSGFANYEVKPKETLFSLAKDFDITQDELIAMNPTLKDGVKVGMILKVPGKGSMTLQQSPAAGSRAIVDLSRSISGNQKKQFVLLLPFNAAKIQGDTAKTIGLRLKKDAFLNMTLDFYSGALMAIDSARALSANIDVHIFDSEETKASSNVAALVEKNNLAKADAILGPFYQQYAEKVAELVGANNVPVISPLSKDEGKPMPNLYQAMPPLEYTKLAMLDYLKAQKGNILVVSDPKRQSNRDFITKNCPEARFVTLAENGSLDAEALKAALAKDKKNYVILDTEKTGMILSTTNVLLGEMSNAQIQIAIIEPNETLDFEEVSMKRLTVLKLLYPSMTRENASPEAQLFENAYRAKNKVFPSQFAVRGFDLTFDVMLRLSQGKTFQDMAGTKTHQVQSQFEYAPRNGGGYSNKGVYILEYQEDLSVKQMN